MEKTDIKIESLLTTNELAYIIMVKLVVNNQRKGERMISIAQIQTGLNMTQAEMAKFLDISIPTYRKLAHHGGDLPLKKADKLIKLYNSKQTDENARISLDDIVL